ncbi:putative HTH-type transcriptional regulator YfiR [Lachnospiraceae bacterium]|nr:putative HTH-type transcriptional regulator YfiR [Lachnospiraceae bacterium]
MSVRGDKTRKDILEKAYGLFAEKGFKDVTMKDICEQTGLSRGGLYRHYESTEQIFLEIVNSFSDRQKVEISSKIERRIPAVTILEEELSGYVKEMLDCENSLSLALCEFFSDPAVSKTDNSVMRQYEGSKSAWMELISYGTRTKEFCCENPEAVFHLIVFAYQGVRMYSRMMKMEKDIPDQIVNEIKRLLLPEEVGHE